MTVAMYLRISKEDQARVLSGGRSRADRESNSIESQRGMILDAVRRMPEYAQAQVAEFCDDGYSGRNFHRPGVEKLFEQVQEGLVQCIVVKDLSRFGRNYLEAGSYLFRVFPALGVRFIALNDGFDSSRGTETDFEASFRTLLYDFYSRDLSQKVKSALYGKARRGEYVCALAPYGYVKDSADKHRIVPDPEAAAQVRRMFEMAANGQSTRQIARTMNEEHIPTPMQYRRRRADSRTVWSCIGEENFWTQQTVVKILRDERYTGTAVYGRQIREHAGDVRQVQAKKADWMTAEGAHPGIVPGHVYALVQEKLYLGRERGSGKKSGHPLLGKVRCGVCGRAMIHAGRKERYFTCHTPRVAPSYDCPAAKIPEACLIEMLQHGIWIHAKAAVDPKRLAKEARFAIHKKRETVSARRCSLQKARSRLETDKKGLYEQYILGQMDKAAYLAAKSTIAEKLEVLSAQIKEAEEIESQAEYRAREIPREQAGQDLLYAAVSQFASDCMRELLREICVYPDCLLKIVWNFHSTLTICQEVINIRR